MSAAIRAGDRVEYGTGTPQGRDRLGEVLRLTRRYREDCALIVPLSLTPGDGTAPDWYPLGMVQPWQQQRWEYDARSDNWHRTYAEIPKSKAGPAQAREPALIPCDARTTVQQIGSGVLMAASGGRVTRRETGVTLPVGSGYSVTVDLAAGDTYIVRRIFKRGHKEWIRGERTEVYCDEVSEAVYFASCFRSYSEHEWPGRRV